jgi:hypothetical protein
MPSPAAHVVVALAPTRPSKLVSLDTQDQLEGVVEWLSSDDESSDVSSGNESAGKGPKKVIIKTEKKKQKEEKRRQLQQALLMKYGSMGNVNRLKLTLEKTRDVNTEGISALTFAARNGHFDCVSLLVGKGAEINKTDNEGVNALLMAATGGHADILKFLLSHKETDIHARDPVVRASSLAPARTTRATDSHAYCLCGCLGQRGASFGLCQRISRMRGALVGERLPGPPDKRPAADAAHARRCWRTR